MIYDASKSLDQKRANERIRYLIESEKVFEIKEKKKIRSLSQNAYLHLILSWYACEYGETSDYIKQEVFKKQVNQEIFKTERVNEKTGETRDSWRSSGSLDSKELSTAIDRFKHYAAKEAGIYLPEPNDMVFLNEIQREIIKNQQYL
jgi:hypothetical protein